MLEGIARSGRGWEGEALLWVACAGGFRCWQWLRPARPFDEDGRS